MKVKEIKKLEPKAKLYEISPDTQYILNIPEHTSINTMVYMQNSLNELGLKIIVFAGEFKLFALEDNDGKTAIGRIP